MSHETTEYTLNELQLRIKTPRFWYNIVNLEKLRWTGNNQELEPKITLAKQRIRKKGRIRAEIFNKKHKLFKYNTGEQVREKGYSKQIEGEISKLFCVYSGPNEIREKIGETTHLLEYIDEGRRIKGIFHISKTKKIM